MGIENLANMLPSPTRALSATGLNPVISQVGRTFNTGSPASNNTKAFATPTLNQENLSNNVSSFTKCGWVSSDLTNLSNAYKVVVTSSAAQSVVIGLLQDKIGFSMDATWKEFIPIQGLKDNVNAVSQFFAGEVLMTRALTRRIWAGTTPIKIKLDFIFEAVTDPWLNVGLPIQTLSSMILPGVHTHSAKIFGETLTLPLLTPPGPSPFGSQEVVKVFNSVGAGAFIPKGFLGGDTITISIGKFLYFDSVVLDRVSPAFDCKMDADGNPISAVCSVEFSTYEVVTKNQLQNSVMVNPGIMF